MGTYTSKYTGEQIDSLLGQVENGGGTGGSYGKTTLWEGELTTVGDTATLSESIENFDYIMVEATYIPETNLYRGLPTSMYDTSIIKANYGTSFKFMGSNYINLMSPSDPQQLQPQYSFTDSTTFTISGIILKKVLSMTVTKIIGIKY